MPKISKVFEIERDRHDKAQRSISSFLGVLMHAATYNIRCKMFWRIKFLRVGIFNRNLTHFVSRKNIG